METMFMAFADRTRLRLLNLMATGEVCVNFFAEALGESQPKVSRHLAYLRNAGLAETRRDGKWVYYSIKWPGGDAIDSILKVTLSALAAGPELEADRDRLSALKATRTSENNDTGYREEVSPQPRGVRPVHNELDEFLL